MRASLIRAVSFQLGATADSPLCARAESAARLDEMLMICRLRHFYAGRLSAPARAGLKPPPISSMLPDGELPSRRYGAIGRRLAASPAGRRVARWSILAWRRLTPDYRSLDCSRHRYSSAKISDDIRRFFGRLSFAAILSLVERRVRFSRRRPRADVRRPPYFQKARSRSISPLLSPFPGRERRNICFEMNGRAPLPPRYRRSSLHCRPACRAIFSEVLDYQQKFQLLPEFLFYFNAIYSLF